MFDKILQFFVKLLPAPLKKLYDKFEELIIYVYYGVLTTILNLIVQGMSQKLLDPLKTFQRWISLECSHGTPSKSKQPLQRQSHG